MSKQTDPAREVVAAASGSAATLESVLGPLGPKDWVALDLGVRTVAWYAYGGLPSVAWVRAGERPANEAALVVALCHPDGRVRQAALAAAGSVPALLPLVVVRCADWVAPVREGARALLRAALDAAAPRAVADVTAVALRVAGRQHGAYARDLLTEFLRSAGRELTDALTTGPDRATRRLGYRIAVGQGRFSAAGLAGIAATYEDVVVQDLCADAALARAAEDGRYAEIVGPLLASRHPRVRAAGVTALNRTGDVEEATAFLTDRSGTVRACARWVLRQHGVDPLPRYRAICAGPYAAVSSGAVTGLGESGAKADAGLLRRLLAHPTGAIRARAVAGLRVLGAVEPERLSPLLMDPSAAVVREASVALVPDATRLSELLLWEHLAPGRPRHVRTAAYRLLSAHRGTVRLRCHLTLLDDEDPRLRAQARAAARRWAPVHGTSGAVAPSFSERAHLDALIDRSAPFLDGATTARLRWYLKSGSR
ncbi:hypothetical protein ACH427_02800 [Streptomyces sp. NPDC020379]|uniref:hypothetical protein n=1 Tax=Streptomyces sp. NPDC020379 TaxID=3365071 RepID=UPI0037B27CCA